MERTISTVDTGFSCVETMISADDLARIVEFSAMGGIMHPTRGPKKLDHYNCARVKDSTAAAGRATNMKTRTKSRARLDERIESMRAAEVLKRPREGGRLATTK